MTGSSKRNVTIIVIVLTEHSSENLTAAATTTPEAAEARTRQEHATARAHSRNHSALIGQASP
jgi:hypothetical protein